MCLAVPGKIIDIKEDTATVDYGIEKREADCSLIECKKGDYVIVSNKVIIDKINKEEAEESLKMYKKALSK